MATGTQKRRVFDSEQDVFDFTRSYLGEAFPNSERQGCPPDDEIKSLASEPTQSNESVSDHFTCCSPCFNAYIAHLAHAKAEEVRSQRIRHATWVSRSLVTAGVALAMVFAIYLFFTKRHSEPTVASRIPAPRNPGTPSQVPATAMYVPVLVDLSNASPVRGLHERGPRPSPQTIPSSALVRLTLQLPIGSEARKYAVRLISNRQVVWSGSAQAYLENGQILLRMHADFTHVPVGTYDLVVASNGFRVTVPVVATIASVWKDLIK